MPDVSLERVSSLATSPTIGATQAPLSLRKFVARSAAFRQALERLCRFARTRLPVLLEGETGTGKTYFAELLHAESDRAHAPFRIVDLSALDDGLAASELFGHAEGAFTGASGRRAGLLASANGGTVFLDEIGKASLGVQAKLLRVLERREIRSLGEDRVQSLDVRFVAATCQPLDDLVRRERFLGDLHFRLQGHRVVVPPLRDRRADIPELVEQFAELRAPECGYAKGPPTFDSRVMRALVAAPWPGNVRQLDQTVTMLLVEADGGQRVTCKHLRYDLEYLADLCPANEEQERAEIEVAIARANNHRGDAARLLSMSRAKFYRQLRKLNMCEREESEAEGDEGDQSGQHRAD